MAGAQLWATLRLFGVSSRSVPLFRRPMRALDRMIRTGFFTNEILGKMDIAAHLLFAGLWQLADKEGRLRNRPDRIKVHVFPYRDADIPALLQALASALDEDDRPFIQFYGDGKYIVIPAFKEHQKTHWNEKESQLPNPEDLTLTSPLQEPVKNLQGSYPVSKNKGISTSISKGISTGISKGKRKEKPVDKRPPIQVLNEYIEKNYDTIKAFGRPYRNIPDGETPHWFWLWIKGEIETMRGWVIAKSSDTPTYKITKPGGFISSWLKRSAASLTEQDEEVVRKQGEVERDPTNPQTVESIMAKATENMK